jgi:hypothetical protein
VEGELSAVPSGIDEIGQTEVNAIKPLVRPTS